MVPGKGATRRSQTMLLRGELGWRRKGGGAPCRSADWPLKLGQTNIRFLKQKKRKSNSLYLLNV